VSGVISGEMACGEAGGEFNGGMVAGECWGALKCGGAVGNGWRASSDFRGIPFGVFWWYFVRWRVPPSTGVAGTWLLMSLGSPFEPRSVGDTYTR